MSRLDMKDIIFGRVLRDPLYRVDFAVGTTYSLDLDTFISLPFSLGFLEEPDEVMRKSVAYIFSALRICSDNLAVFCNYSDIKVPPECRRLYYALMEGSVFPINVGKKNKIVNFHPKVWVIEQTGLHEDDTIIRVIIMSRNLTKDGSLDCACVLTGKVKNREASARARKKHQPLCDFLMYLSKKASSKKRRRIENLVQDIYCIESFDIEGSQFDDYDFFPMGIPNYSGRPVLDEIGSAPSVGVVSPFIDDTVMERFDNTREKILVTRELSITDAAVSAFGKENIYTMNPQMVDNDLEECVDLHAKMYFTSSYRRDEEHWRNHLYMGSTNATMGGFDRNIEFLVRFRFLRSRFSWREFSSYFKEDSENRFVNMIRVSPVPDERRAEYERSLALRKAATAVGTAEAIPDGEKTWKVSMQVSDFGGEAKIRPLMRHDLIQPLVPGVSFPGMALIELSEFYVIEAEGLSRVIKVQTTGIPDDRDAEICRRVIPTKAEFMDCISFLLSESKTTYVLEHQMLEKAISGKNDASRDGTEYAAIYENLLRQVYESPASFKDIQTFVSSLPQDRVPEEFQSLYEKISKAIKSFKR